MGQCCAQLCDLLRGGDGSLLQPGQGHARELELTRVVAHGGRSEEVDRRAQEEDNRAHREALKFIGRVAIFKRLPKSDHPLLALACVPVTYMAGQVVIRQGDPGHELFIVKRGQADVFVSTLMPDGNTENQKVDVLQAGDHFGEAALVREGPRTATVVAKTNLETLRLARSDFERFGLVSRFRWPRRVAVGAGKATSAEPERTPSPKTPEERVNLASALKANRGLRTIFQLDDVRVGQLVDAAWMQTVSRGEDIITEGDLRTDFFYVVRSGSFRVLPRASSLEGSPAVGGLPTSESMSSVTSFSGGSTPASPESRLGYDGASTPGVVSTIGPGGSFGELALLYASPRTATVRADVDSTVWVIGRQDFKRVLLQSSDDKVDENARILTCVDAFSKMPKEDLREVAKALVEAYFERGEAIVTQGEPGSTLYVLQEGEVAVLGDGVEINRTRRKDDGAVPFFGERALVNGERRTASVVVTSAYARVLALDRDTTDLLLGAEIFNQMDITRAPSYRRPKLMSFDHQRSFDKRTRYKKDEMKKIGLLGFGGFGRVELWEHEGTGNTFAMKMLSKGYIVKSGMQKSVINEKEVLISTDSPFIIRLYECFSDAERLFFLMEVALGGELFTVYRVKALHGKWDHAKFYVAGVLHAFEHLHERRIVYRDLKPENLLLDERGWPKLTDMGLAKFVVGKTFTACGTPDYFAPEIITNAGHNAAVDWWTCGILLFELLAGSPPFEAKQPMAICINIRTGIDAVRFPLPVQAPSVKNLVQGLLRKEPSERLPMRQGGTANVREHVWYTNFDWKAFRKLTMRPPYLPVVKNPKDPGNFFASEQDAPRMVPYVDPGTGWEDDFDT